MKTRTIQKQLLGSSEFVEDNTPIGNSYPITNPFAHINYSSKNQLTNQSINTKSLQEYSKKCDTVLFRCDWISVICPHDKLLNAPLFFVPNDTNSSEKLISVE